MNHPLVPLSAVCFVLGACSLMLNEDSLSSVKPPTETSGAGGTEPAASGQRGVDEGAAGDGSGPSGGGMLGDAAGAGGVSGAVNAAGGAPSSAGLAGSVVAGATSAGAGGASGGAAGVGVAGMPSCPAGASGCACLADGSCNAGLTCVAAACRAQVGCAPPTVVDDMEDNDRAICPSQARSGMWFVYAASATGRITPASDSLLRPVSLESDPRPSSDSAWAMRLAGSGFGNVPASDYAALGLSFRLESGSARPYDVSAHQGFTFWAKSDVPLKMRLNLTTIASRGELQGGACTGMCNDHYGLFFDVSSAWRQYTVTFGAITQQGWGKVVAKDLTRVISADFMYVGSYEGSRLTHDNPSSFSFLVDDVVLH